MAIVIDSLPIHGMRVTDFDQLLFYIELAERDGCYYGNKEQFTKRHNRIKDCVEFWVNRLHDEGVRIPK